MFSYEFTGCVCKNGHAVANAVCEALDMLYSKGGRVTNDVASKAADLLNSVNFDGGKWDAECVLATVENCVFTLDDPA